MKGKDQVEAAASALVAWDEAGAFFRFQPAGLELTHTSLCSDDSALPAGYVFAYDGLPQAIAGRGEWLCSGEEEEELVAFLGEDSYDPGDAAGVAVRPVRELGRLPFETAAAALATY